MEGFIKRLKAWQGDTKLSFVHQTRSTQPASLEEPRVLVFANEAKFIAAFTLKNDGSEGTETVELIEFDDSSSQFKFGRLDFSGASENTPATFSLDSSACKSCHTKALRPNWDTYPFWPGIYGAAHGHDDSAPFRTKEQELWNRFVESKSSNSRMKALGAIDLSQMSVSLIGTINSEITHELFRLNRARVIKEPLFFGHAIDTRYELDAAFKNKEFEAPFLQPRNGFFGAVSFSKLVEERAIQYDEDRQLRHSLAGFQAYNKSRENAELEYLDTLVSYLGVQLRKGIDVSHQSMAVWYGKKSRNELKQLIYSNDKIRAPVESVGVVFMSGTGGASRMAAGMHGR